MAAPLHIAPEADPDERDASLGWLCPTEAHRARMLDMTVRVERARNIAMAAVGVGLFASIGQLGWRVFVLFGIAVLNVATLEPRIRRASRPERVVATSLLSMGLLIAAGAAMSGGGTSPGLAWLVIPVAVTAVRFRAHVVWAAAGVAGFVA
ncbi:MAG: two-component system, cell cycle response regulator, partial [Thermoleophilaceae bacterium]|nr:two-component system, cell cycle response regulator [Thermoleophilaceae bacterium]